MIARYNSIAAQHEHLVEKYCHLLEPRWRVW
jgi:hypothetical protein